MTVKLNFVSAKDLRDHTFRRGTVRAGVTTNPEVRAFFYERDGYSGTMYLARTRDMRRAEDKLFSRRDYRHNVQRRSNAKAEPGYVYLIVGRKSSG